MAEAQQDKPRTNSTSTANPGAEESGSTPAHLPKDGASGITTHSAGEEREQQEKVIGNK